MIEVIDRDTMVKMMALILCGIRYEKNTYVVFAIRRDKIDANLFVSKVTKNSSGFTMDDCFSNGEKEVVDGIVQKFLNHVPREELENSGFVIIDDILLSGIQYYDINKCYVSTVPLIKVKEMMKYYSFIRETIFEQPILDVQEDRRIFNEGYIGNLFLILLGIGVIVFCVFVVMMTFLK